MRKLVVLLAVAALFGGSVFCGSASPPSGGSNSGADAGADAATGGLDAGTDGGTGGTDAGSDAGTATDAGSDAGADAGTDGGIVGGTDAGIDGGLDGGTDGGVDAGTDGGTDTIGALCASLGDTLTPLVASCLKVTPAFVGSLATTFSADACQDVSRAVAAGRATYDDSNGRACLSAVQAGGCAALATSFTSDACQGVLAGTVPNGGSCYTDVDCSAGTCSNAATCPGTCIAFIAAGQPCGFSVDGECGPGLDCDSGSNTCKATSAAGGPCPCRGATYCDAQNTCQNQKTSGSCTSSGDECAVGYTCLDSACTALVGLGAACTPPATAGGQSECGLGSYCDPAQSKCLEWPSIGLSCATFSFCTTGYCDSTTELCTAFKAAGADCSSPFGECAAGNYCDLLPPPGGGGTSKCTAQKANGAGCTTSFECLSGNCDIATQQCTPVQTTTICHEP